ncbi:hypothetical protein Bbelb_036530 [Branchiostoma belcheri]|nr:hypothetical protein Bbelb_036530 [Branchiostoma belcheri]
MPVSIIVPEVPHAAALSDCLQMCASCCLPGASPGSWSSFENGQRWTPEEQDPPDSPGSWSSFENGQRWTPEEQDPPDSPPSSLLLGNGQRSTPEEQVLFYLCRGREYEAARKRTHML